MLSKASLPVQRRRASSRGFTLIELVTVVLIIGIIAVIATPTMAAQFRERRSRQAAQEIALLFSNARMRALGRGTAVLVRYTAGEGFSVLESIEGSTAATGRGAANCATLPGAGCLTTNWSDPDADSYRKVASFPIPADSDLTLTVPAELRICFTPMGRTFASATAANPSLPMVGVTTIGVKRGAYGLLREVVVLPNGSARLAL